jgi:hypothetical protein
MLNLQNVTVSVLFFCQNYFLLKNNIPIADTPVFSLDLVDFSPPHNIIHMVNNIIFLCGFCLQFYKSNQVVSSNILVMALANCHIIRLNLANPSKLIGILLILFFFFRQCHVVFNFVARKMWRYHEKRASVFTSCISIRPAII